ncbi:uncharacterized protein LOC119894039 isoform X4 [Micropterus salmoides]|uniref:uncharacterized protein LOC119894039 isoform X4 n=1 Tax=Micropterus salmoides TaxID=27706 RepID=UPI0018EA52B7|nr:uncharacterized protein LOC119894039 isoform X4 [Micropterus salmoides]
MGGRNCCVPSCRRKSHDHRRRKIPNGLTFHCFPAWRRNEGEQISELTMRRRAAWVAAVGRGDITFNHIPTSMRVCSRHFHSGKPAYEMLESDPDWIPSLHLGPRDGTSRRTEHLSEQRDRDQKRRLTPETGPSPLSTTAQREPEGGIPAYEMLESSSDWVPSLQLGSSEGTSRPAECLLLSEQRDRDQKQRLTPETGPSPVCRTAQREPEGAGPVGTAVRPWREVKSLLQSVLLPRDETGEQPPAAKKMDLSFRDFFRDALEASLEACSRSRSPSARQTSVSGDYEVELNFKLPPVKEENQTCDVSSSSGCLNCVSLQRTIVELQEKLSRLTGEQQEVEALLQPDQVLQSPETGHTEETETAWMEPLSPPEDDQDSSVRSTPTEPGVHQGDSPKICTPRRAARFQDAWLKRFWFLRYSETLNQMWCHVCRLNADQSSRKSALIKGSRVFHITNIKKHGTSTYHKDNVERYMQLASELKLGDISNISADMTG